MVVEVIALLGIVVVEAVELLSSISSELLPKLKNGFQPLTFSST